MTLAPLLPYDVYAAAEFFLQTGRSEQQVVARLGMSALDWRKLAAAYFDQLHNSDYLWKIEQLHPEVSRDALITGLAGPRWQPPADGTSVATWTRSVRSAVHTAPHIGPFADVPWTATFIMFDPVAWLRYYSHDGAHVYYCGQRVADKAGVPIEVDCATFHHLGGRWYSDGSRIFGQGELGGTRHYFRTLEGADPATFTVLNLRYAKDSRRAWYITGKEIRTKSAHTFEVLPWMRLNYRDVKREFFTDTSRLARDAEAVYFYGTRLKGAKPATFRDLGHEYATDGTTVWFLGTKKVVAGADAASFIVPGPGEPYVQGGSGSAAVSDRFRCYDVGKPADPRDNVERWRPFFEFRSDLIGWWWHEHARL